jgi:hypothetical protein
MKRLIIGITVLVAFHVGNVEAAQWMPLDEAEDRQLIRTNQSPEEGHIICTSKTRGGGKGIAKDGRRLGFLTKKGCKTIGGGDKVRWFKRENGDIMVLVDDEPAVQDDAQNEGEDYQARYEEARDAAAKAVQQLQDAQEREANLQEQHDAALEGMVSEEDVDRRVGAALVGMVTADDVQGKIDAALEGMVSEADVTPLNCSDGTAVNYAGDACEPTAEYRAAAVAEGAASVKSSFDYGGEEAGWVPKPGGERWDFVRGVGMPSHIVVYGQEYGGKILVKSEDGGWEEDTSNPYKEATPVIVTHRTDLPGVRLSLGFNVSLY